MNSGRNDGWIVCSRVLRTSNGVTGRQVCSSTAENYALSKLVAMAPVIAAAALGYKLGRAGIFDGPDSGQSNSDARVSSRSGTMGCSRSIRPMLLERLGVGSEVIVVVVGVEKCRKSRSSEHLDGQWQEISTRKSRESSFHDVLLLLPWGDCGASRVFPQLMSSIHQHSSLRLFLLPSL